MTTIKTPQEVAQATLDAHCIKPDWRRTGGQIAALIAEAVEADRAQRVAHAEARECDECDTREGDEGYSGRPVELNRWGKLTPPVQMCPSCTHNAYRSGWEPGQ